MPSFVPRPPILLVAASDLKEGRPARFCDVTLRQVDTSITSCQPTVSQPNSWNIAGSRDWRSRHQWVVINMRVVLASAKRYAIAQTRWQPDGWLAEVTFVSTWRNVTSQNRPGLPYFKSEATIKSLGRPGDEAKYTNFFVINLVVIILYL